MIPYMAESANPKRKKGAVGRPRKASAGEAATDKRDQILQGALVVFLEHGYAGASIDMIIKEAGVSKQTVYAYFTSKEELFTALIEKMVGKFSAGMMQPQLFQLETPQLLRAVATMMLEKLSSWEYIAFLRLLIGESARFPELTQKYITTAVLPGQQLLTFYFQKLVDLPDQEAAAWMFNGAIIAYILRQEILQAKHTMVMPRQRYVESVVDILMYASEQNKRIK
jgi:AcrR family transcriptional regulator